MLRLFFDEDAANRAVLAALLRAGHDIVSVESEGRLRGLDPDQLAFATAVGRVLYTCNAGDFARLHGLEYPARHAGIILVIPQRMPIGEQLRRLEALSSALTQEQMRGRLEYLANWGSS